MPWFIERRLAPAEGPLAVAVTMGCAILVALLLGGGLFALFDTNPVTAYLTLFGEAFASWRGIGFSLVKAAPLTLIALGTVVAWRSGFGYLGYEGCFVIGATAATGFALLGREGGSPGPLPFAVFLPLCILCSVVAGGIWAGAAGMLRARFGGNEVLISLMSNYVAILIVQYLISGPMRAPGGLPQSERIPQETWLPFIIPGTRAHAGILIAMAAAVSVWVLLKKTPVGFEMIVTGLNPSAARYGGIATGRRILLAAFLAGGMSGLAGMVELLGVQHRLVDGMSGGVGFVGVVVALLARLNPIWVLSTAVLYGGMTVGADAMQRTSGVPSSITFILQSLIVLLVLASELARRYRVRRRVGAAGMAKGRP